MKITSNIENDVITISLEGRLDTTTSPELQDELDKLLTKTKFNLILDFKNLSYVSSAGLRVLLSAQKKANDVVGTVVIRNVSDSIMEVFDMTGFSDFLNIEPPAQSK